MENISLPGVTGSSSKPLGVGRVSQHSDHDDGPSSSSASGHPASPKKRRSKGNKRGRDLDLDMAAFPGPSLRNGKQKKPRLNSSSGPLSPTQVFQAPADKSGLPREIWNHICLFLPPKTLGNLLRVNKLFNTYLDPSSSFAVQDQSPPLTQSIAKAIDPNDIWRQARRSFWAKIPGPFKDMTELELWRLVCSSTCQFCGRKDTRPQLQPSDPYRYGPGANGVARIWEFRVRCCGSCFSKRTVKEMDIILSTASTFLLPALQFVIANQDNIVIPLHIIKSGKLPPTDTLSKLFWSADVETLREEFSHVKELGLAAADEWQKGLSTRGSQRRAEISKWQKQEESGGVSSMRTRMYHSHKEPKTAAQERAAPQAAEALPHVAATEATKAVETTPAALPVVRTKKTKEEIDAEWDEIQGPVRQKILMYANEAITGDWDEGEAVTKNNAPSFAADVLLHVRKRFYTEVENMASAARAAGRQPVVDPPEGPFTQKLSLENMKYVFDIKVKPITGKLCKELFLCHDCDYSDKFFGFEGVIQHFAAKHTTTLSQGNTVVAWRGEWPAYPPFKANPCPPKSSSLLTLPAKPPSSGSAKNAKTRHASQGAPQGHVHRQESNGPPQPTQHLPLHTAPFLTDAMAAPLYATPLPYAMPFPDTGVHLTNGPQEQIPFTHSQHNFQPKSQPQPYQQYPGPPYYNGGYQANPNAPGVYGTNMVHTRTDAAVSSGAASPGFVATRGDATIKVLGGHANAHHINKEAKLNAIATHAGGLWRATENMYHLPPAVRCHTVYFHLNNFYKKQFNKAIPLALFTEALLTRQELQPMLKAKSRLACKACQVSLEGTGADATNAVKYPIVGLLGHFEESHVFYEWDGELSRSSRDWLTDMLLLNGPGTLSKMAGNQGKKLPLLFASLEGLPPRQTETVYVGGHAKRTRRGGAAKQRHKQAAGNPEGAGGERAQDASQRHAVHALRQVREPSAVIKREESPGLVFNRADPRPPRQPITANAAVPEASDRDILGALEMHLNRGPAQRNEYDNDDRKHLVHHERAELGHNVHAGAVSFDHRYGAVRPQADRMRQNAALRHETHTPDDTTMQARVAQAQYRERSPLRACQDQYSAMYDYDSHGQQIHPQQQPPPPPPAEAQGQCYVREAMDREYSDRYSEQATQASPVPVGYDPYEAYEVVRVVHPEGDYLVRRPVRRQMAGPSYYRQAAPPVYKDPTARPAYGQEYYTEPPGYTRAPYETPMYDRPQTACDGALAGPASMAAPSEPHYGEYDAHPVTGAARHWPGAPTREGGEHQKRYV